MQIKVDYHYVRDKIPSGDVANPFVKPEDQLADIFTKSLSKNWLEFVCSKLSLYYIYAPA